MYNDENERSSKNSSGFFNKFFRKRTKRLLTNIDRLFTKIMWYEILCSIIFVILGVIFLIWPEISIQVVSVLFGANILGIGFIQLFAFSKRRDIPLFAFSVVYGILGIILGIFTILNPFLFSKIITFFIGLWLIYLAITKVDLGIRMKIIGESSWLLMLVSALLEIFMSIIIFINPFSNLLLTEITGAYLVLIGILNSADAILTKNRSIDFLENL